MCDDQKYCTLCNIEWQDLKPLNSDNLDGNHKSFAQTIQQCFNLNFPLCEGDASCSECLKELTIANVFRNKVEEAIRKKMFEASENANTKVMESELRIALENNFDNIDVEDGLTVGEITVKKRKTVEEFDDLENNIFIVDLDEMSHKTDLEDSIKQIYKPQGTFYIRPLTEQARKKILKSLELKKRLANVNYKKEQNLNLTDKTIENSKMGENDLTNQSIVLQNDIPNSNSNKEMLLNSVACTSKKKRNDKTCARYKGISRKTNKYPPIPRDCKDCPVCGSKYETHKQLLPHYRRHFNTFLCYKCGNTYTSSYELLIHMKTHGNATYRCPMCPKKYKSKNLVLHHVKRFHKRMKLYSCSLCNVRFSYLVSRRQHDYEVHGVEKFNYPCTECDKLFFRTPDLQRHMKLVHLNQRDFVCLLCERTFFTSRILKDHMVTHTGIKDYHCEKCGKSFSRLGSLKQHLKIHLDIKEHKCHVCLREFVQKVTLKLHLKTHGITLT